MIEIIGLYSIIAITFTFGKILLVYLPPIFLIGLRMTIAGSMILIAQYALGRKILVSKKDILFLLLLSFVHIFMSYVTESIALQNVSPSCAALLFNLVPCFTALFAYIFLKEIMTLKKWVGFGIAFIGVWYVMPNEDLFCYTHISSSFILLFISVISSALGWIFFKKLLDKGYDALQLNGLAMILGGIESFIVGYYTESLPSNLWYQSIHFWALFFGIILFGNVIFYNLYGYLLRKYSPTFLSFVGFITPAFTASYDYIFLGLTVGIEFYLAMVVVAYGIYIFYQEELRQGYVLK